MVNKAHQTSKLFKRLLTINWIATKFLYRSRLKTMQTRNQQLKNLNHAKFKQFLFHFQQMQKIYIDQDANKVVCLRLSLKHIDVSLTKTFESFVQIFIIHHFVQSAFLSKFSSEKSK